MLTMSSSSIYFDTDLTLCRIIPHCNVQRVMDFGLAMLFSPKVWVPFFVPNLSHYTHAHDPSPSVSLCHVFIVISLVNLGPLAYFQLTLSSYNKSSDYFGMDWTQLLYWHNIWSKKFLFCPVKAIKTVKTMDHLLWVIAMKDHQTNDLCAHGGWEPTMKLFFFFLKLMTYALMDHSLLVLFVLEYNRGICWGKKVTGLWTITFKKMRVSNSKDHRMSPAPYP